MAQQVDADPLARSNRRPTLFQSSSIRSAYPCRHLAARYVGIAGATVARYDLNPPSATANVIGLPRYIGCASPPVPPPAFAVNNPGNRTTYIYESVLLQVTATGGTPSYTWSATGLPFGLPIDSSTGVMSGTVSRFGSTTVTVTAVDAAGRSASTQFRWTVAREPCPTC